MKVIEIHQSGLNLYRRCRRAWDYREHQNIIQIGDPSEHLFFGSAFHYALEDIHGGQRHPSALSAFKGYMRGHLAIGEKIPSNSEELVDLADDMLAYYTGYWREQHEQDIQTWTIEGKPAVEVEFKIPLGIWLSSDVLGGNDPEPVEVWAAGKFDGLATDEYGRLWIREYKTAARIDSLKLENDFQVSFYVWAATRLFGHCEGILYYQFSKSPPVFPPQLKNGRLSQDKRIRTSRALYRAALLKLYGFIPQEYVDHLNYLGELETQNGDQFIRLDRVRRNKHQVIAIDRQIRAQIAEIISGPEIYPNPTFLCASQCEYRALCVAEDDGSDIDALRQMLYTQGTDERESWRKTLAVLGTKPIMIEGGDA